MPKSQQEKDRIQFRELLKNKGIRVKDSMKKTINMPPRFLNVSHTAFNTSEGFQTASQMSTVTTF